MKNIDYLGTKYRAFENGNINSNIIGIMLLLIVTMFFAGIASADVVNINKADAQALQDNLEGVGEVKSKAIVDYRKKNGNF